MARLSQPCPVEVGKRVRVTGVQRNDPDPLPVGLEGTVTGGNGDQIWVDWDPIPGSHKRTLILLADDPYLVL